MQRDRLPYLLIPLAAFIAILPLLIQGCSCGHDFDFHLLNWMEAARQFSHGNLHPQWAYTPAYNAGEPRFVFYPPLSWTLGAVLTLISPITITPILYTWLALTASGLALHRLAKDFAPSTAAVLAAILYTVNPYMLFTAYERTAYAELLAAAWIPLLLHATLREQVTIPRIAIPVALLWLTNAPAAVMSCYVLALLTVIRLALRPPTLNHTKTPSAPYLDSEMWASHANATSRQAPSTASQTRLQLAFNTISGTILGFALAAFYILPAAYERRYVQIAMAIIPNMRVQDNFLFHHTGDIPHDQVLHTASLVSVILLAATLVIILCSSILHTLTLKSSAPRSRTTNILLQLAMLTIVIALLLTPLTATLWNHAPELAFLQFPWRFLAILASVLGLATALALNPLHLKPALRTVTAISLAAALTYPAYHLFHQPCDEEDTPTAREALFHSYQGTEPTDEYTPTTADNDSLAHTNPPFWLSLDPNAKAPTGAQPGPAPTHLALNAPTPEDLILNLRAYPGWLITLNGHPVTATLDQRDDGLIALPIQAGSSTIDITYAHTPSQSPYQAIGDAISLLSLAILPFTLRRRSPASVS